MSRCLDEARGDGCAQFSQLKLYHPLWMYVVSISEQVSYLVPGSSLFFQLNTKEVARSLRSKEVIASLMHSAN